MKQVDPQPGTTRRNPTCRGSEAVASLPVRPVEGTDHGTTPCDARARRRIHHHPRCPWPIPDPKRPTHPRPRKFFIQDIRPRVGLGWGLDRHRPQATQARPTCPASRGGDGHGTLGGERHAAARGAARCLARLADGAAAGARRADLQPRRAGRGPRRRRRPKPARPRAGPGHPMDQPAMPVEADPPRPGPRPLPCPAHPDREPNR